MCSLEFLTNSTLPETTSGRGGDGGPPSSPNKSINARLHGGGGTPKDCQNQSDRRGGWLTVATTQPVNQLLFIPLTGRGRLLTHLKSREEVCKRQLPQAPKSQRDFYGYSYYLLLLPLLPLLLLPLLPLLLRRRLLLLDCFYYYYYYTCYCYCYCYFY